MIKKILLFYLLTGSFYFSINAQTLIPRMGLAISTNTYQPTAPPGEVHTRTTLSYGIGFEFHLIHNLNLLVASDYVSKGYKFHSDQPGYRPDIRSIWDVETQHNYLEFPVMLKKYYGSDPVKFYLSAGPYLGIGLGGTYKGESGTYDRGFANSYYKWEGKVLYGTDPGISTGAKNRYYAHRIDYGFVAGIGVILFNRVALDARYEWGNVDVDDGLGDFKNRAMLISIGVPLKLKGSDNSN